MTASFALGQIVGPLLVGGLVRFAAGFSYALAIAAAVLLAAAVALAMGGNAAAPRVIQCPTRHEQEP
jgi:hypothetical protein